MIEIKLADITPSPFQHRKKFHGIDELAESLKREGLIHPIVVREVADKFELVVGERRLRATKTFAKTITAIVKEYTDLEARRVVAAENMQRDNPSAIEEVEAIIGMVDAELYDNEEYVGFGETDVLRVKFLLTKLDSDYKNNTDKFRHKFMSKIESIFSQLPRKKEWRSFYVNDLPTLGIDEEVIDIAIDNKLNKSQTKALGKLKKEAPKKFKELVESVDEDGVIDVGVDDDGEKVTLQDTSAKEIKDKQYSYEQLKSNHVVHVSEGNNDWYTPEKYIESARLVLGSIDLDPASSELAQKTVKAKVYYTAATNGLDKTWDCNTVWMNPPYSMPEIQGFIDKLIESEVKEWIVLTNNSSDTNWFHKLLSECEFTCFTKGRVGFENIQDEVMATRQGQVFFYKGSNKNKFISEFNQYGAILEVLHDHSS